MNLDFLRILLYNEGVIKNKFQKEDRIMTCNVQIEGIGLVTYEESGWSGKKKLFINGQEVSKVNKKTFQLEGQTIELIGSYMFGLKMKYNGQEYTILPKLSWYEYVLAILPIVFDWVWSNVPSLCNVFPIVGGLIGGVIVAISAVSQVIVFRSVKKPIAKVGIGLAFFAGTVLVLFAVALIILSAIG